MKPPTGPTAPLWIHLPQASATSVTLTWEDISTDEQQFAVYHRDRNGNWQIIDRVPTRDMAGAGGIYTYVDTSRWVSGQCYMIGAFNADGAGDTTEQCTVRPDPSTFPQSVPSDVQQWRGLSSVNDGTGDLQTTTRSSRSELTWSGETWGIDLDWSDSPALWKVEAQGGPHLMRGQAVALRVWGGGWLVYGHQDWGVDLVLSDTPSYEWYVLGGTPGSPLTGATPFALWNSAADDYLVFGTQTFGVDLNWDKKLPSGTTTTPPPPAGVRAFQAYNCITEQRPLAMWVLDVTAGTGWVEQGSLSSQLGGSGCGPNTGQTPWTFTPPARHTYMVEAVDYLAPGCSDDPSGPCWRFKSASFVGDPNGQVACVEIGGTGCTVPRP
jgi:hypothetical protein